MATAGNAASPHFDPCRKNVRVTGRLQLRPMQISPWRMRRSRFDERYWPQSRANEQKVKAVLKRLVSPRYSADGIRDYRSKFPRKSSNKRVRGRLRKEMGTLERGSCRVNDPREYEITRDSINRESASRDSNFSVDGDVVLSYD